MKRITLIFFVIIFLAITLSSLSFSKDASDTTVALIVKDLTNPFFVDMKLAGQAAANQYGVNYICLAPEKYSIENQIRIMEDLIQKKVDAIVIVPIDGKGIVSGVERANKAGIPIFNCNTKVAGGEIIGFSGIDHISCGRVLAQFLVDKMGEKGKIVILEGTTGSSTARDRLIGVHEILDKYTNIEILASTTAKYNRQMGMKTMEDLLVRFSEIDAALCMNDAMALGAKEAVIDTKREILIGGIDAIPEALDAIKNGELAGTVDSNGFGQAFTAVDLTCRYLLYGEEPPKDTKVGTGLPVAITLENLAEFEKFKADRLKKYGL